MMSNTNDQARLAKLKAELDQADNQSTNPQQLDDEWGERGDYLKVSITLPADLLMEAKQLAVKRRAKGQKGATVSALVREALTHLVRLEKRFNENQEP